MALYLTEKIQTESSLLPRPAFPLFGAFLTLGLFLATMSVAQVRVIDGDTLEIDGKGYRIHGIDAPEIGQKCGGWHCGKEAANELLSLIAGQAVQCEALDTDRYGRLIAICRAGGTDLGQALVERGFAWAYREYSGDYVPQEDKARSARLGVWQSNNQPPWEFRKERWREAINQSPREGCPIKGNISQNGQIYHTPWSPWYNRTKINEAKGERWFCDELEAVQAGWRAPYWP
ncbi:MAG: thermonuclease family protein [Pseudomonadota bacterium]